MGVRAVEHRKPIIMTGKEKTQEGEHYTERVLPQAWPQDIHVYPKPEATNKE